MKQLFICSFALALSFAGIYSCDSTNPPSDILTEQPVIKSLSVSPQNVQFTAANDGVKDTSITVTISAAADNLNDSLPSFSVTDQITEQVVVMGKLEKQSQANIYSREISFDTKTTFFEEYQVNVFVFDAQGNGNYAQAKLNFTGFSNISPEIIDTDNPASVQRPESGSRTVTFTAKATDQEGQDTIEGVFLRLISRESGEVANSPFRLYDDGASLGDVTANDSVYTLTFPYNSGNQLQTYDILYYAVDKGGLVSDTVKTTFSIVE